MIKNKFLTWDMVDTIMQYGMMTGIGQFRTGGYGRFTVVEATEPVKVSLAEIAAMSYEKEEAKHEGRSE